MSASGNWNRTAGILLLITSAIGVGSWLWHCWCVFPWLLWNELRLEPSFLLAQGLSVYPGPGAGPVTTWIYGPVTPVLFLPATMAASSASALLIAGSINTLVVVGAVVTVGWFWPSPEGTNVRWQSRLAAILLCLAAWPASSFQYIQADNAAVAFGLIANLILVRGRPDSNISRWFAAATAVAAVGCKQTAIGLLIAQLVWLVWREGLTGMFRQAVRIGACGIALVLASVALFDPAGLWLNLVDVPGHIPWTSESFTRIKDLTPLLAIHLGTPLIVFAIAGRTIWNPCSPWLLPALSWAAALPLGLASLFKLGGTLNSLESFLLFLPPAMAMLAASPRHTRQLQSTFAAAALVVSVVRLANAQNPAWRPRTNQLQQAEMIARQSPGQIWFPWNPLVTYYAEQRFDHVEDGLYVRFVAGHSMSYAETRAHLPPDWHGMAVLTGSSEWGLASHFCPANATVNHVGFWTVTTWPSAKSP